MSDHDETETQVESIMFAPCEHIDYPIGAKPQAMLRWGRENEEQARFLEREGEMQEAREVAFCKGMLVGGVIALAVLTVTLWLVGVM